MTYGMNQNAPGDGEADEDGEAEADGVYEADALGDADPLGDLDGESEPLIDALGVGLPLALGEAETEGVGLSLALGEADADGDAEAEGDFEEDSEADGDADALVKSHLIARNFLTNPATFFRSATPATETGEKDTKSVQIAPSALSSTVTVTSWNDPRSRPGTCRSKIPPTFPPRSTGVLSVFPGSAVSTSRPWSNRPSMRRGSVSPTSRVITYFAFALVSAPRSAILVQIAARAPSIITAFSPISSPAKPYDTS